MRKVLKKGRKRNKCLGICLNRTSRYMKLLSKFNIEDKLVKKQMMQAPKEILIANFLQTAKQIENDQRPIKIKMVRPEVIWDNFENKEKVLNNEILVSNNAMMSWEENKQEVQNENIKK